MTSTGRDNQLQFVHFSEGKQFEQFKSAITKAAFLLRIMSIIHGFNFFKYTQRVNFPIEIALLSNTLEINQSFGPAITIKSMLKTNTVK